MRRIMLCLSALALAAPGPLQAASFDFSADAAGITVNDTSISQTADGIGVTVQGFAAEIDGADATVLGPFPTSGGVSGLDPFGIDLRNLGNEGLGLIAQPLPGIDANGSDQGAGVLAPGFNSFYWTPLDAPGKFDFAVFEFDQAVDVGSVTVDDTSNFGRSIWAAWGNTAPDFSDGFLDGIADFTVLNSDDDFGDGLFTHAIDAMNLTYLLVGARPQDDLGPLASGPGQFTIEMLNAIATSVGSGGGGGGNGDGDGDFGGGGGGPVNGVIPLPAPFLLLLSAMGSLFLAAGRGYQRSPQG